MSNPAIGRPWRGLCARYTEEAAIRARHSDEQARNHNHHSGDEYSQARKQHKVAQEYMHTPASPYLPACWGDHDISGYCPWFDARHWNHHELFRSGAQALVPGQRRRRGSSSSNRHAPDALGVSALPRESGQIADHLGMSACRLQAQAVCSPPIRRRRLRDQTPVSLNSSCGRLGGYDGWWFWPRSGQRPVSYLGRIRSELA